jgi:hypothetical protein
VCVCVYVYYTDGKNVLEEFYSAPRDGEGGLLAAPQARAIVILLAGADLVQCQKRPSTVSKET